MPWECDPNARYFVKGIRDDCILNAPMRRAPLSPTFIDFPQYIIENLDAMPKNKYPKGAKRVSFEYIKSLVRKEEISIRGVMMSAYQITEQGIEALQKYGH